jgi:hypothetical protein
LAKRHEARALPVLIASLEQPEITDRVVEAAYTMLGLKDDQKDWSAQDHVGALRQRFHMVSNNEI